MTPPRTKVDEPNPAAVTPGDNRGAEDLDGNKAGARTGNKGRGPDDPARQPDRKTELEPGKNP
jgi:hypothetical protein